MISQSVNLTHLCLEKEIKYILSSRPHFPYRSFLEDQNYKQQIVDRILARIPNRQMIVTELLELPQESSSFFPQCPINERIEIEKLIRSAIVEILCDRFAPMTAKNVA